MKCCLAFLCALMLSSFSPIFAQVELAYYLPEGITYDPSIPTPASVLGFEVGEWHVSHDKLLQYMNTLASVSERLEIDTIGYTYEGRPLVHLTISTPKNLQNIEAIRTAHLQLSDPKQSGNAQIEGMPVVTWMGYSIHGNEASGSNAALLVAYHLAAAQGEAIEKMLDKMVVLLDPSFNPDGMQRFSTWVNSHRSLKNLDPNSYSREHQEAWPGGRTNHYWFDLNRDWLPVQHPESQARIRQFHRWKPNYLTDHHEMGTNSTFFFQPGIPSRNNPITPQSTFSLTYQMADYYAAALDKIGSLYYTEESFDDFYYGKGSTYPDVNGAVGILFEQGSSRGHLQNSIHGPLSFPFTIRNHFVSSLATLLGTSELRLELLKHQQSFYQTAIGEAQKDDTKAYIVSTGKDPARMQAFLEMLLAHQIQVYPNRSNLSEGGKRFEAGSSYLIPTEQAQYRLIRAMFEQVTSFQDSLFYDVSAWTLPLAFGLEYAALDGKNVARKQSEQPLQAADITQGELQGIGTFAYAFDWHGYYAPRALNQLLEAGLRAKVATQPFTSKAGRSFEAGAIVIPAANQTMEPPEIQQLMERVATKNGLEIVGLKSGMSSGVRLGSSSFEPLKKPKVILLVDGNVRSYDAGEVWHLLDYRQEMEVSLVPVQSLASVPLEEFTALVMVSGGYQDLSTGSISKLGDWVNGGGTLIGFQRALNWLDQHNLMNLKFLTPDKDLAEGPIRYEDREKIRGAQVTGGAIFQAEMDRSHPLCFGYEQDRMALFRNSNLLLNRQNSSANQPLWYSESPLLSGYISEENLANLAGTAALQVEKRGRGHVIAFADNPNFRAFWYGTNKLFLNAIFFGSVID